MSVHYQGGILSCLAFFFCNGLVVEFNALGIVNVLNKKDDDLTKASNVYS